MKKFLILFLAVQATFAQHTNVQNELKIQDAVFLNFQHKINKQIAPTLTNANQYLKPYISYVNPNGVSQDFMMDSFVFVDDYFQFKPQEDPQNYPYDGKYSDVYLNMYMNDIFKRTKLPIIVNNGLNNKAGFIGKNMGSTLSYTSININGSLPQTTELKFKFDYKLDGNYAPDPNDLYTVNMYVGWEYFNSSGVEVYPYPMIDPDYSAWYDIYLKGFKNTIVNNGHITHDIPVPTNLGITTVKIHIINYAMGGNTSIKIDNVELKKNQTAPNLISVGDRNFDSNYDEENTNWEFDKNFATSKFQYLFKDRTALITEVKNARDNINSFSPPTAKVILTLPGINFDHYLSTTQLKTEIKTHISNYIENIVSRFNSWENEFPSQNVGVEIAGLYVIQEDLYNPDIDEILEHARNELGKYGLQLYGSPYTNIHKNSEPCLTQTSYVDNIHNLFDILWHQPNAFYYDYNRGYMDSNILKNSNNFISSKGFNVNIETNSFEDEVQSEYNNIDGYGRVNDYFWYGEKYGFINYSKVFYDDSGLHYRNAYSTNSNQRIDYDNLYKFITKARKGVVINPEFETINDNNNYHNWEGNYLTQENLFSYSANRNFKVTVDSTTPLESEYIPIEKSKQYVLSVKARENLNDNQSNSARLEVRFYDKSNTLLGTKNYDFNTDTNFSPFEAIINTAAPLNQSVVKFKFFLKKMKTANIEFKDMKFAVNNTSPKFRPIYNDTGSALIKIENEYDFGSHSLKLYYDGNLQSAITSEKISVMPNKSYSLELWTKELLSPNITNATDKALIGIEAYNQAGQKINFGLTIPGFQYTTNTLTPMHYRYIGNINQVWNKFSTTINFPTDVASIKIHIYNWYYGNYIHFDNFSFELTPSLGTITIEESENLLKSDRWTEKMPLIASYQQPVIYKDLINVSDYKKLKFTAKLRDTYTSASNNDLLAIEFYDENYNLLTDEDSDISSQTNFVWSSFYKYWWDETYFNIDSWGCENSETIKWYNNQWNLYKREIEIPLKVKYIRVSFQKLSDSDDDFLILNPTLIGEERPNLEVLNPLYAVKE